MASVYIRLGKSCLHQIYTFHRDQKPMDYSFVGIPVFSMDQSRRYHHLAHRTIYSDDCFPHWCQAKGNLLRSTVLPHRMLSPSERTMLRESYLTGHSQSKNIMPPSTIPYHISHSSRESLISPTCSDKDNGGSLRSISKIEDQSSNLSINW
jgi:hypothetical protein